MKQVKTEDLLRLLHSQLEKGFNGDGVNRTGFVLTIFPFNADMNAVPKPEVHYTSNVPDEQIGPVFKDLIEGLGYHTFLKAKP